MLSRVLLWVILIFMGFQASGQETYRVLFAGGRSYLVTENRFSKLKAGQRIESDAELELVGDSRVVLMDNAGRLTSFGLGGRYALQGLEMSSADSSLFFKSVWEEYFRVQDQALSVQEQLLSDSFTSTPFELSIPSSSQVFGTDQIIEWPHHSEEGYRVNLINEFGEVFKSFEQAENHLKLDMLAPDLVWKSEVSIQVETINGRKTPLHTLHKMSPPDYEDMDRLLRRHFSGEEFEVLLTKAAFFENRWHFADAQTVLQTLRQQYELLMKDFWKNYLFRNGFYAMSRL